MKKIVFLLALMCATFATAATDIHVIAHIDSVAMLMGDQCNLTFQFEQQPNESVVQPLFSDTIVQGLDIIEHHRDTLALDNGQLQVRSNYLLTSYDTTLLYVPQYPFIVGEDTMYSNAVSVKVLGFPVDTTKAITDIVTVVDPPIDWNRIAWICLIVLIAIVMVYIAYRIIKKIRFKEENTEIEEIIDPRTAFDIALEHLEEIEKESIWQQGKVKQYYSEIVDVLKQYMQHRFEISVLDKPSDELMEELHKVDEITSKQVLLATLNKLFKLSDLVKFAKYIPDNTEHQNALIQAKDFIENTPVKLEESEENSNPDEPQGEVQKLESLKENSCYTKKSFDLNSTDIENSPYAPK